MASRSGNPRAPFARHTDLIHVPAGSFVYGSSEAELLWVLEHYRGLSRRHLHGEAPWEVAESGPFFIDRNLVTNRQFAAFIAADGYSEQRWWTEEGWRWRQAVPRDRPRYWGDAEWAAWTQDDHPVIGVTWFEADAYARWCGMRLPTEREWERAARGVDGRRFPWGDDFEAGRCNTADHWVGHEIRDVIVWMRAFEQRKPWRERCLTTPVGAFPRGVSPTGALDMAGNVWEWCADSVGGDAAEVCEDRICRGGSFGYFGFAARTTDRGHHPPTWCSLGNGFRCVADVEG